MLERTSPGNPFHLPVALKAYLDLPAFVLATGRLSPSCCWRRVSLVICGVIRSVTDCDVSPCYCRLFNTRAKVFWWKCSDTWKTPSRVSKGSAECRMGTPTWLRKPIASLYNMTTAFQFIRQSMLSWICPGWNLSHSRVCVTDTMHNRISFWLQVQAHLWIMHCKYYLQYKNA